MAGIATSNLLLIRNMTASWRRVSSSISCNHPHSRSECCCSPSSTNECHSFYLNHRNVTEHRFRSCHCPEAMPGAFKSAALAKGNRHLSMMHHAMVVNSPSPADMSPTIAAQSFWTVDSISSHGQGIALHQCSSVCLAHIPQTTHSNESDSNSYAGSIQHASAPAD